MAISRLDLNERAMQRLIESLRTGRMFSMTGAGLSHWAGYPLWPDLLSQMERLVAEVCDQEVNVDVIRDLYKDSPLQHARKLGQYLGDPFLPFLRDRFGVKGGKSLPPVLLQYASLPFRHHLTLNYDDSLERSHPNGLQSCGSVTWHNRATEIEFLERCDDPDYGKKVLHCHGLHSDPLDGFILTEPGYAAMYQDEGAFFKKVYWSLLSTRSFLFAGFGFSDKDFLDVLRGWARDTRSRGNHLRHFAICGLADSQNDQAVRTQFKDEYRIDCIFYDILPNHDHRAFAELIGSLSQSLGTFDALRQLPQQEMPIAELNPNDAARLEELAATMARRTERGIPNV